MCRGGRDGDARGGWIVSGAVEKTFLPASISSCFFFLGGNRISDESKACLYASITLFIASGKHIHIFNENERRKKTIQILTMVAFHSNYVSRYPDTPIEHHHIDDRTYAPIPLSRPRHVM